VDNSNFVNLLGFLFFTWSSCSMHPHPALFGGEKSRRGNQVTFQILIIDKSSSSCWILFL